MARKPRVLALSFFPAFHPPSSGGEMRLGGLYRELSRHYDVTLMTSTDFGARFEEVRHTPNFRELRFPKDEHWRKAYATLETSGLQGDLSPLAFALAVSDPECELRRAAREQARGCALIIHDFPYSEPIFSDGAPAPEIFNSHNVEAGLLSAIVQGPGFDAAWLKLLRLEGNLVRRAQKIFASSEADAEIFRLLYGAPEETLFLCPNGYDEEEIGAVARARAQKPPRDGAEAPKLLFTGSGHYPNVEAADKLLSLAVHMPDCRFIVAGGVCKAIEHRPRPDNVELFGPFTARQKHELLVGADLYLNPVTLGSGTSLKAVEALAANLPMVSTPQGARGLGLTADVHAALPPREEFIPAIRRALAHPDFAARLAAQGRELAQEQFSWATIADRLAFSLAAPTPPKSASPAAAAGAQRLFPVRPAIGRRGPAAQYSRQSRQRCGAGHFRRTDADRASGAGPAANWRGQERGSPRLRTGGQRGPADFRQRRRGGPVRRQQPRAARSRLGTGATRPGRDFRTSLHGSGAGRAAQGAARSAGRL